MEKIELILPAESESSFWIEFDQNFESILEYRAKLNKRLELLKIEHSQLTKNKDNPALHNSPEESLRIQAQRIERRYELEKQIRLLEKKNTQKFFSRKRRPAMQFRLSDGRQIEVVLKHRNLQGNLRILPNQPVFEMKFPGPTKIIKFKLENTFGRDIRINKVSANPIKYGMFDVNLLTANIKANTNVPSQTTDFLRGFVKIPKISIAGNNAYQPYSAGHPDHFTVNDLEMYHDDQRVWDILRRENLLEFDVGFSVHTNIVPVVSFKAKIRLVKTQLLDDADVLDLGQQSVEVQTSHHLTLSNPFNQAMETRLYVVPREFLQMNDMSGESSGDGESIVCKVNYYQIYKFDLSDFQSSFYLP